MTYNNSRTMTVSIKVTAEEKIRYKQIAESHDVSFSEWAASILNMYHNAYGELKINSIREEELLNEIDQLEKKVFFLESLVKFQETQIKIESSGLGSY